MKNTTFLRKLIREFIIQEADYSDITDEEIGCGSTHELKTCKIGSDVYYLKWSYEPLFAPGIEPSLQPIVEYLAYRIYSLYAGIRVPKHELVYDAANRRVGIATTPAYGKQATYSGISNEAFGKMMSQGVYVDIFLCNWDVVAPGNVIVSVDKSVMTRIDPGGSLTFRAQGGRKDNKFNITASELTSMLTDNGRGTGAGVVFKHSDLKIAAKEFMTVPWSAIETIIEKTRYEVDEQLLSRKMISLSKQWNDDCDTIRDTLSQRHNVISANAAGQLGSPTR